MKKKLIIAVLLCCAILGCGGSGGSTSQLVTVSLVHNPGTDRLEADMVTGNSCSTGGGTFKTETVPITVTTTAYSNTFTPSPVTIKSISITYKPYSVAAAAHPLPVQYDTGGTIMPGTSQTFNVKVAPDSLKLQMVNDMGFQLCSLDYWEYYAEITFTGEEDLTKKTVSFSDTVKVAFADRNNTN